MVWLRHQLLCLFLYKTSKKFLSFFLTSGHFWFPLAVDMKNQGKLAPAAPRQDQEFLSEMKAGILQLLDGGTISGVARKHFHIPSRELTYPTLGKGASSSNVPLGGDMLFFRRVYESLKSYAEGLGVYVRQNEVATLAKSSSKDNDFRTAKYFPWN